MLVGMVGQIARWIGVVNVGFGPLGQRRPRVFARYSRLICGAAGVK
jgi:hypothetical protein